MFKKMGPFAFVVSMYFEDYTAWVKTWSDRRLKVVLGVLTGTFFLLGTPGLDFILIGWGDDMLQMAVMAIAGPIIAELQARRGDVREIEGSISDRTARAVLDHETDPKAVEKLTKLLDPRDGSSEFVPSTTPGG